MPTACTDDDPIAAVAAGDAVCLSGWDAAAMPTPRPKVRRATQQNLLAYKTVYGVCEQVVGGLPQILVSGEVAKQAVTGLATAAGGGPPTGTLVVTDFYNTTGLPGPPTSQQKLRHIYQPQKDVANPNGTVVYDAVPEQYVVGTSDELGNLAIQPRHTSHETGFPRVYNLKSYGGVPDWDPNKDANAWTDNLPAFKRALAAMQADGNVSAKLVADGRFYFSDGLVLNQTILFEGTCTNEPQLAGGPVVPAPGPDATLRASAPGTWLVFPPTNAAGKRVTGIRIHSGALRPDGTPSELDAETSLAGSSAAKTFLRNLTLFCTALDDMVPQGPDETDPAWNPFEGQSHGVHASATFYAENVTVEYFAGDGFHAIGFYADPAGRDSGGSVDESRLRNCAVGRCGRDGFHFYGVDATACIIDSCVSDVNRRYGFYDLTRQNTYIACKAEDNGGGLPNAFGPDVGCEWRTEGDSNSSTLLGCYAEGEGARCQLYGQVTVIGGVMGNNNTSQDSTVFLLEHGVASRAPHAYYNDRGRAGILAAHPEYSPDAVTSLTASFTVGGLNGSEVDAFSWSVTDWDPATIPFQPPGGPLIPKPLPRFADTTTLVYTDDATAYGYQWWSLRDNGVYRDVMRFPTVGANARLAAPWFPKGIFLGGEDGYLNTLTRYPKGVNLTAWSTGYQPLTSQPEEQADTFPLTYELGDVLWNASPAAGTAVGQVCTAAGTAGSPRNIATTTSGTIAANSPIVPMTNVTGFAAAQYVTIAGVSGVFQVASVDPVLSQLSLTQNVSTSSIAAPVAVAVVTVAQTLAGSQTVSVDTTKNLIVGQYITIAGIAAPAVRRITAVSNLMNSIQIDGGDPGNAGPNAVLAFSHPAFATFGGTRGTLTVAVTMATQSLGVSAYETIKLTGNLGAATTLKVPAEDGWSARFLDVTVRNNNTLTVVADVPPALVGTSYQLPNGQTQRLYIEFDGTVYNVRPECPAALGPVAFDPATLTLTGWWRASYGGAPWTGTQSSPAGSSQSHNMVHDANDPSQGATLNSLVSASFNGTNDDLNTTVSNSTFFGSHGSFWCLFASTSAPTASGFDYADGTFLTDRTNAETTIGYVSIAGTPTLVACIYSSPNYVRHPGVAVAADGSPHLAQVKWDGTNIWIRVDRGAWSSHACGNYTPLTTSNPTIGQAYGTLRFDGDIWEMACAATALADTDFDNVLSYVNTRYGLAF